MLALIYWALAIALGDLICRRFYRFVSVPHRWAAAVLVGMLLSTWFTYLAGLGSAFTAEPLLCADLLFFVAAPGAIFWLSRKAPRVSTIAPRAPGSSTWDSITLGALFSPACVLLIRTLYVNKQGMVRLSGKQTSDLAAQLGIATVSPLVITFRRSRHQARLSSVQTSDCQNCEVIKKYLQYELYKAK
jgi:hypothetical protein